MKRFFPFAIILAGCFISQSNFAQNSSCLQIPMQEVKVVKASEATYKNEDLSKGQSISLPKEIPMFLDESFFECNHLNIAEGGELQFYDRTKKAFRHLKYEDLAGNTRTYKSERSSNAVSRGEDEGDLNYCNDSGILNANFHLFNLIKDEIYICNYECLQIYFKEYYFQLSDDMLTFNPEDYYIKGLLFQLDNGEEVKFLKSNNEIIIESDELPEEALVNLYLISLDGSSSHLLSHKYINLDKIITRLKKENYTTKEIENTLYQTYLAPVSENLSQLNLRKELQQNISKNIQIK